MKHCKFFLISLCFFSIALAEPELPFVAHSQPSSVLVNNRILATVNGKTISVIDVMKKMDVFLNRVYPQAAESPQMRYQFYSTHWRDTLEQMIDAELIMLDSEGKDMKVTDSDVRESIQERFGPNIMTNLDKLGLSYEEAKKMIHSELIVQRMMWFRVNSKAILSVNPMDVKKAYKDYCQKNPAFEEWKYQVLSIRAKDASLGELLVQKARHLWEIEKQDLVTIASQLKSHPIPENARESFHLVNSNDSPPDKELFSVQLSEEYTMTDKNLSKSHREILQKLTPGEISEPISQINRIDKQIVFRLFHLKDHRKTDLITFEKIFEKLENDLINQAVERETSSYISKIRERLSFDASILHENIPAGFQPFELR